MTRRTVVKQYMRATEHEIRAGHVQGFIKRRYNSGEKWFNSLLTEWGKMYCIAKPMSLPQAAPVSNDGMKSPLGTLTPYVQHANRK